MSVMDQLIFRRLPAGIVKVPAGLTYITAFELIPPTYLILPTGSSAVPIGDFALSAPSPLATWRRGKPRATLGGNTANGYSYTEDVGVLIECLGGEVR